MNSQNPYDQSTSEGNDKDGLGGEVYGPDDHIPFIPTPDSIGGQSDEKPLDYELKLIAATLESSLDPVSHIAFDVASGTAPLYSGDDVSLFSATSQLESSYSQTLLRSTSMYREDDPGSQLASFANFESERKAVSAPNSPMLPKAKKYFCNYPNCGKGFTTVGHLVRHSKIHSGDKEFGCPWEGCGKRFSRQDNMRQHYRTHFRVRKNRRSTTLSQKAQSATSSPRTGWQSSSSTTAYCYLPGEVSPSSQSLNGASDILSQHSSKHNSTPPSIVNSPSFSCSPGIPDGAPDYAAYVSSDNLPSVVVDELQAQLARGRESLLGHLGLPENFHNHNV